MKRIIALLLCGVLLLSGCSRKANTPLKDTNDHLDSKVEFSKLNDLSLLSYVEDEIYSELEDTFSTDCISVEQVVTTYISKEYVEELEYNSKENVYFGYALSELYEQFEGKPYVFALDENGNTIVREVQAYDDTYNRIIKNVIVGSGVVLVCVTVSIATAGVGSGAISVIFAASAKTATEFAMSSSVMSGVVAGVTEYLGTEDLDAAIKAAALKGSEGFKWGAITGAIIGGSNEAFSLYRASKRIPTPQESELRALNKYQGEEQVSFLNGEIVSSTTPNATRPDLVRDKGGVLEAIEVKNYNLESSTSRHNLYKELERQVSDRVSNLPKDSIQRVVLDVKGRKFSDDLIEMVIQNIQNRCESIYPNLPVDVMY